MKTRSIFAGFLLVFTSPSHAIIQSPTINADSRRFDIQMFYEEGTGSAGGMEAGWEYNFSVTRTGPDTGDFIGFANYLASGEENSFFGSFVWGQWTPTAILYDTRDNYASGDSSFRLVSSISNPDGSGGFVFHAARFPAIGVPDGGSTVLLLLIGCASLIPRLPGIRRPRSGQYRPSYQHHLAGPPCPGWNVLTHQ